MIDNAGACCGIIKPQNSAQRDSDGDFRWRDGACEGMMNRMKLFYSGPVANTELLVVMLEKHGICARQIMEEEAGEEEDLNRLARVYVREEDYGRAHDLFYREREDEL